MKISVDQKKLMRRYLLWCYKTTREAYEKTERKSTQLLVDAHILNSLQRCPDAKALTSGGKIPEFQEYVFNKENDYRKQKFSDSQKGQLNIEYCYLQNRLAAIEKAAESFLGEKSFIEIKDLYEEEMTRRILEAREHA